MQQIVLPFGLLKNLSEPDDFIVSKANLLAYNTILGWPNSWGVRPYEKTLIIKASKSGGKTILAKIWAKISSAVFIYSYSDITDIVLSKYNAFIIDGLDDNWKEEDLLYCFNYFNENNKYLLLTCRDIYNITLPDLSSRISSINIITIDPPNDELIKILIFKLFSNYSVTIRIEVIHYLVKVLPREYSKIINIVNKVNELALISKKKITIPFVKKIIKDYFDINK